jgi:hypothetical protein
MPLSMLSTVFTGNNETGTARLFGVGTSHRYNAIDHNEMTNYGISRNLSSATVYASSSCDATLLLFGPPANFVSLPDYTGWFVQVTNPKNASSELDVNLPSSINDHATNMLLVSANKGFEIRQSFRDLFLSQWNSTLDASLSGSQARRNGDPVLTWEMFPTGISHLDSSRRYLKIQQPLKIVLDWWPDYDAWISYHIYLYLDGASKLRGYVARWAYWVEGGIKSGAIASSLEPKVISGMSTLNSQLNDKLDALSFSFSDLYYLPGRQLNRAPRGTLSGTTWDDVTIVLGL